MTDGEILGLFSDGQREKAFACIVDKYGERLYWHVRHMVCSHEDSDDLMQEIFVKVWHSLPKYRGEAQLYTWLYSIATNYSLNFLRRQKTRAALQFKSVTPEMENKIDEDPYFDGNDAQRALVKAIAKLPDKQRAVFNMRYFDELSYEEISEITGTSVGALKASFHIASEKIKAEVTKYSLSR